MDTVETKKIRRTRMLSTMHGRRVNTNSPDCFICETKFTSNALECLECPGYYICDTCHEQGREEERHHPNHLFKKIRFEFQ